MNRPEQYPEIGELQFETRLMMLNLEEECALDLATDNGFLIGRPKNGLKKNIKDPNGIFSPKFGQTLDDLNAFKDKYQCECKELQGRAYNGMTCKKCGTKVRFVDRNFDYFGWIRIKNGYKIIHPTLYKLLERLIGSQTLNRIIDLVDEKGIDGYTSKEQTQKKKNPKEKYAGIGMQAFREQFDEIIEYYYHKRKKKNEYKIIRKNRNKVFTNAIPVYTALLRAYRVDGDNFSFGSTNELFNIMVNLIDRVNRNSLSIHKIAKPKLQLLYKTQMKYNTLYDEIVSTLSEKKGAIRLLYGGRYNFTSRNVIIPDPTLDIDKIALSYTALVELLQGQLINILQKSYNMSYDEAYKKWLNASINYDDKILNIMNSIIKNGTKITTINGEEIIREGIPISFGGIMQMFVTKVTKDYTMGVPLQILNVLAADFDQLVA